MATWMGTVLKNFDGQKNNGMAVIRSVCKNKTMPVLSNLAVTKINNTTAMNDVMAASAIANIVKSSLGPVGLDKMLVDDIGDVPITNDGATILRLLEVEHPAAKILVELAQLQDEEVGDGTTSVVIVAADLLKNADELVKQKIHPTSVIGGYSCLAVDGQEDDPLG